jgi:hypothetical protein
MFSFNSIQDSVTGPLCYSPRILLIIAKTIHYFLVLKFADPSRPYTFEDKLRLIGDRQRIDRNIHPLFLYLFPFPFPERPQSNNGKGAGGYNAKRRNAGTGKIPQQDVVRSEKVVPIAHDFFPNTFV